MKSFRIALLQTAYDSAEGAMVEKVTRLTAEAAAQGATLICLPEFSLSSYFPARPSQGDADPLPESVPHGTSAKLFATLATEHKVFVIGSLYERGGMGFRRKKIERYSSATLFTPEGALGGLCRRQHVSAQDVEYFAPGNADYPVFGVPEKANVAIPTGYDQWFPELARIYAMRGAELVVYPTAVTGEEADAWLTMLRSYAIANAMYVAGVNRVGTEEGTTFSGGSCVIAPNGEVVAQASGTDEEILYAELDPALVNAWRQRFPLVERREPQTYKWLLFRATRRTDGTTETAPTEAATVQAGDTAPSDAEIAEGGDGD